MSMPAFERRTRLPAAKCRGAARSALGNRRVREMMRQPWLRRRRTPDVEGTDILRALQLSDDVGLVIVVVGNQGHAARTFDHDTGGVDIIGIDVVAGPMPAGTPGEFLVVL